MQPLPYMSDEVRAIPMKLASAAKPAKSKQFVQSADSSVFLSLRSAGLLFRSKRLGVHPRRLARRLPKLWAVFETSQSCSNHPNLRGRHHVTSGATISAHLGLKQHTDDAIDGEIPETTDSRAVTQLSISLWREAVPSAPPPLS